MAMSVDDYKLKYEDLSTDELLDDLMYKAASRHEIRFRTGTFFKEQKAEINKQIKAIKAVIMERTK